MGCRKTCKVDKLLRQPQRDVVCGQRQRLPTAKKSNQIRRTDKVSLSCQDFSQRECAQRISSCSPTHCRTLHVWQSLIVFWHFHIAKHFDLWLSGWGRGWTLLRPKVGCVWYHSCHHRSIKLGVGYFLLKTITTVTFVKPNVIVT